MAVTTIEVKEIPTKTEDKPKTAIDLSGLAISRDVILDLADTVATDRSIDPRILDQMRQSLEEEISNVENILKSASGIFVVKFLKPGAPTKEKQRRLVDSFGTGNDQVLLFPTTNMNAVKVLPNESPNILNPAINARISTPLDKPISVFEMGRGTVEQPSQGQWYQFPLKDVEIGVIE